MELKRSGVDVQRARAMRAEGLSLREIGVRLGVTGERIRQVAGDIKRPPTTRGPCSVEGCGRISEARGLCHLHYSRLRVYGDVHHGRVENVFHVRKVLTKANGRDGIDHYGIGLPRAVGKRLYGRTFVFAEADETGIRFEAAP